MDEMFDTELDTLEIDNFEYAPDQEFGAVTEEGPFTDNEEIDLATELLAVTSDAELDQFLGNLIRRAGRAAGVVVRSPVGRALGGILRNAAKKALPVIGSAVGGYLGGPSGANIGSKLATSAGSMFGLEVEGLTGEDMEYQVARKFVRFAGSAAAKAARAPATASPVALARAAVTSAARVHAPGLVGSNSYSHQSHHCVPSARMGRWIRRGRNIILVNC